MDNSPLPKPRMPDLAAMKHIARQLGLSWEEVLDRAGISRSSAWRLEKLKVGGATLRRVWAVLNAESELQAPGSTKIPTDRLDAWDSAGRHLLIEDEQLFSHVVELVTKFVRVSRDRHATAEDIVDTLEGGIALIDYTRAEQRKEERRAKRRRDEDS